MNAIVTINSRMVGKPSFTGLWKGCPVIPSATALHWANAAKQLSSNGLGQPGRGPTQPTLRPHHKISLAKTLPWQKEDFSGDDCQSGPLGSSTLEIEKLDSSGNRCGFFRRRRPVHLLRGAPERS